MFWVAVVLLMTGRLGSLDLVTPLNVPFVASVSPPPPPPRHWSGLRFCRLLPSRSHQALEDPEGSSVDALPTGYEGSGLQQAQQQARQGAGKWGQEMG